MLAAFRRRAPKTGAERNPRLSPDGSNAALAYARGNHATAMLPAVLMTFPVGGVWDFGLVREYRYGI